MELEYEAEKKRTRRDRFLGDLEQLVPWAALVEALEAHYPKSGRRGRPPIGLERTLRLYIAQQCFGLSDEGAEDAVYDTQVIRRFVDIALSLEEAPDVTTLLKFRHPWPSAAYCSRRVRWSMRRPSRRRARPRI
ncbi:hypothetical protein BJI67_15600 [Acidihalobacter aeolianus]|uniref:Transposase InsH N-terminal domain-containing protein n=1 Tax=Acidihalobacter aeolianus TaxID=2792603 RepID=A0A1D8KBE9_9GAMM|nr:hypothetical protein BJI67_15600 [Acidihalobacter aeolianus]